MPRNQSSLHTSGDRFYHATTNHRYQHQIPATCHIGTSKNASTTLWPDFVLLDKQVHVLYWIQLQPQLFYPHKIGLRFLKFILIFFFFFFFFAFQLPIMAIIWGNWIHSPSFLTRGQLLWLSVCFPAHQVPSEKGSTLKGKNLLPQGANSFLLV